MALSLQEPIDEAYKKLEAYLKGEGFFLTKIYGDGNCLFRAIAGTA